MKASRAPGPVQSYSILHNKRADVPSGRKVAKPAGGERKGNKTVLAADANQGVLRQYRNLDDIPDLDDNAWGPPSHQGSSISATAYGSATGFRSGATHQGYDSPRQETGDDWEYEHQLQSAIGSSSSSAAAAAASQPPRHIYSAPKPAQATAGHQYQDVGDDDEVEEVYDDLGYGQADTHYSAHPAPHFGREDEPIDSEEEDLQVYSSPRKPITPAAGSATQRKGGVGSSSSTSSAAQSKQKVVTMTMSKSRTGKAAPAAAAAAVGVQRVAVPVTIPSPRAPSKLQPSLEAPPLPCENLRDDQESTVATETDGRSQLYFSKQPRPVEYKPYTLKQYNLIKPKEYVEIAKIQPDLNTDELVAKRRNQERIREFSKQLRTFNQGSIAQQRKLPSASEQNDLHKARQKYSSSRHRALEFAKQIPRPADSVHDPRGGEGHSPHSEGSGAGWRGGEGGADGLDADWAELSPRQSLSAGQTGTAKRIRKTLRHEAKGLAGTHQQRTQTVLGASTAKQIADREDDEAMARLLELEAMHLHKKAQVDAIRKTMGPKGVR